MRSEEFVFLILMDVDQVLLKAGQIDPQIKHISNDCYVDQQNARMKPAQVARQFKNFERNVHSA
jgi:hypothetical protein